MAHGKKRHKKRSDAAHNSTLERARRLMVSAQVSQLDQQRLEQALGWERRDLRRVVERIERQLVVEPTPPPAPEVRPRRSPWRGYPAGYMHPDFREDRGERQC
jgi:hypothetical protein